MTPIAKYLDEVMKRKGIKSERQLSIKLGISTGTVYNITNGVNTPSDDLCEKLAALSGDPIEKVLLIAAESRAPKATQHVWHNILLKLSKAGAFSLALAAVWWTVSTSSLPLPHVNDVPQWILCKMLLPSVNPADASFRATSSAPRY